MDLSLAADLERLKNALAPNASRGVYYPETAVYSASGKNVDLKNFEAQILTTGFPFEHRVASLLRDAGWSVIANKYYIDDLEQTVREVDLVAYRVRRVHHFAVYTTLIVSCKKNDKNVWALLSRPVRNPDPNMDVEPFHAWSSDGPMQYVFAQPGWAATYYLQARQAGVQRILDVPTCDIFAFQEMDRESGKAHNDKAIFSAITSLMKAQAYELDALPKRRKEAAVYSFHLLSVVDSDIVRLDFGNGSSAATAVPVTDELYVARYHQSSTDFCTRSVCCGVALRDALDRIRQTSRRQLQALW